MRSCATVRRTRLVTLVGSLHSTVNVRQELVDSACASSAGCVACTRQEPAERRACPTYLVVSPPSASRLTAATVQLAHPVAAGAATLELELDGVLPGRVVRQQVPGGGDQVGRIDHAPAGAAS